MDPVYSLTLENFHYHAHIYRFVGETSKETSNTETLQEQKQSGNAAEQVRAPENNRQETESLKELREEMKRLKDTMKENLEEKELLKRQLQMSKDAFEGLHEDNRRLNETLANQRWFPENFIFPAVIAFLSALFAYLFSKQ